MSLSEKEVLQQSKAAFGQWETEWRKNSKINGKIFENSITFDDLMYAGAGKNLICIAFGASLEDQIKVIKKHKNDSTDIICVDKAFGYLIEHGIKPNYVIIADAGVSYKEWCEKWVEETKDIILVSNINANTEWTTNWKGGICFYVNKDNIQSEKIFCEISGCNQIIPAGSNVGNSVLIFSTQVLGYREYYLVGYDSGWGDDDNYYAFKDSDKRHWMKHIYLIDCKGRRFYTSHNLLFSARWLGDYYIKVLAQHGIKVYNCCGKGILSFIPYGKLESKLKKSEYKKLTVEQVNRVLTSKSNQVNYVGNEIQALNTHQLFDVKNINKDDYMIDSIIVNYLPKKEVIKWQNR